MTTHTRPTKVEQQYAKKVGVPVETVWQLENTEQVLFYVHPFDACKGDTCVLHKMTDHRMRSFPQYWRSDRRIMERICPHGVGHPDPDQYDFWRVSLGKDWKWETVHGCDGCCVE